MENDAPWSGPELPELLLLRFLPLLVAADLPGPVLDLAAGECRHGLLLAQAGLPVQCYDRDAAALDRGRERAERLGVEIGTRCLDLERPEAAPLAPAAFGAVLVFRYLWRPLLAAIRACLRPGGILIYETYTEAQRVFGRPHRAQHLLRAGELRSAFRDWQIVHSFEGVLTHPERACAQLVARKPGP